jgi:hypothetical protein
VLLNALLSFMEDYHMTGAEMTIARYYAREAVKRELRGQGIKLQQVEASEITRAANAYIDNHPEIITFATERYQDLVKSGRLRPPRMRRKPSQ